MRKPQPRIRTNEIRRRAAAAGLAVGLAAGLLPAAAPLAGEVPVAGAALHDEYRVKAAFLYNFAKFTRWPAKAFVNAWEPLRVCVLGQDPFGPALATIDGKRIGTRRLAVRRVVSPDELDGCHMVFVGGGAGPARSGILEELAGRPILTVSDKTAAGSDSMIRLRTVAEKVRFHVDAETARRAGLRFSAKLLSLSQPDGNASAAIADDTPAG